MKKKQKTLVGWEERPNWVGKPGPEAKCKGCLKKIKKDELCIRYGYRYGLNHAKHQVDQYHVKVGCLKRLNESDKESIKNIKWINEETRIVCNNC